MCDVDKSCYINELPQTEKSAPRAADHNLASHRTEMYSGLGRTRAPTYTRLQIRMPAPSAHGSVTVRMCRHQTGVGQR